MDDPIREFYRVRRIAWFTVVGVLIWPVGLLMALLFPEERKHWMRVFTASLILTVIALVCLGVKRMLE